MADPGPPGSRHPRHEGPSLRDVAREAGVSVMTASNVVRGAPGVSDSTRARVLGVIESLGYRPNASARQLRGGRAGVISFAVPHIDAPYFAELARLVMTEADRYGWTVLVDQTRAGEEQERRVIGGLARTRVDGTVLFPQALSATQVEQAASAHPHGHTRPALVLLGDRAAAGNTDAVVVDNVGAAREATDHLIALGRRRVAAIGVERPDRSEMATRRLTGYREAIDAAGLSPFVPPVRGFSRAEGAAATAALLDADEPPDAVFCFSDVLALGALYAANAAGVRVPEDLAIVGFDDIEDARYSWPPLTTIQPDKPDIARRAIAMLHERLSAGRPRVATDAAGTEDFENGSAEGERAGHEGESSPVTGAAGRTVHAAHRLVVRGSTGPPPARRS